MPSLFSLYLVPTSASILLCEVFNNKVSNSLSLGSTQGTIAVVPTTCKLYLMIVASFDQPVVKAVTQAVDKSAKSAENSCADSAEAINQCRSLLDRTTWELVEDISEMCNTAKQAHVAATQTGQMFISLRTELRQVCWGPPAIC